MLAAVVPQQASAPQQPPPAAPPAGAPPQGAPQGGPGGPGGPRGRARPQPVQTVTVTHVPLELFNVPDGLEVTLWAETPMLRNPTNMDIDRDGRIWVAEGVRYRSHHARQPEGDRIVVLEDTDKDGKADKTWTFVQEVDLVAPLGIAVIDNKIVVSQPPDLIVYTDVDRNLKFDPAVDKREVLLTGFQGKNHDHSLHSVTVGPDGKWMFNQGNTGGMFTDKSGKTFRSFGAYRDGPVGPFKNPHNQNELAGKPSDDGHTYVGGFTVRMNPDGTQRRDHRPQLPQQLRAVDHLARRRLPERQRRSAGVPRQLGDGVRQLRLLVERRPARLAGGSPARASRRRSPSGGRTTRA